MANRKGNKRKSAGSRKPQAKSPPQREESTAAEGITVAWMLASLGTGLCELVVLLAMAALAYEPLAARLPERATVLPWLLLFVAVVTGSFALLLTPFVLKQRSTPPPNSVVNFAIFVGVVAWALFLGSMWI